MSVKFYMYNYGVTRLIAVIFLRTSIRSLVHRTEYRYDHNDQWLARFGPSASFLPPSLPSILSLFSPVTLLSHGQNTDTTLPNVIHTPRAKHGNGVAGSRPQRAGKGIVHIISAARHALGSRSDGRFGFLNWEGVRFLCK